MSGLHLPSRQPNVRGPRRSSLVTPPSEYAARENDFTTYATQSSTPTVQRSMTNDSTHASFSGRTSATQGCGFCTDTQNCVCNSSGDVEDPAPSAGNCSACLLDPVRAQACRLGAASVSQDAQMENASGPRISCSNLMDQAERSGQDPAIVGSLVADGRLDAYPSTDGRYEVDEHEAAQMMVELSSVPRRNSNSTGKSD